MDGDRRQVLAQLSEPFEADEVDWRLGTESKDKSSAMALAYIDARCATARLDAVMGPFWQCEYHELRAQVQRAPEAEDRGEGRKKKKARSPSILVCRIGLSFDEGKTWIWRSDGSGDTDFEAEKGALSGAFKRAAVKWGIGAYLYGFDSPWVEIEPAGWSYKIKRHEWPKLRALAASALARYKASPRDFRAPEPDPEPVRPGFKPEPEAPARPTPPARPAEPAPPGASPDVLLAALRGAASLAVAVDTVLRARRELSGEGLVAFDAAYADLVCAWAETYATQRQPEAIEALAQALGTKGQGPSKADHARVLAALTKARREARAS